MSELDDPSSASWGTGLFLVAEAFAAHFPLDDFHEQLRW
jgi:hypothetical protein